MEQDCITSNISEDGLAGPSRLASNATTTSRLQPNHDETLKYDNPSIVNDVQSSTATNSGEKSITQPVLAVDQAQRSTNPNSLHLSAMSTQNRSSATLAGKPFQAPSNLNKFKSVSGSLSQAAWSLQKPVYIEGDFDTFPAHLFEHLQDYCIKNKTFHIPCSTGLWTDVEGPAKKTLFIPSPRKIGKWVIRDTEETVKMGRFALESRFQLIVAQHPKFNDGKLSLVMYGGTARLLKGEYKKGIFRTRWIVWEPLASSRTLQELERIIQPDPKYRGSRLRVESNIDYDNDSDSMPLVNLIKRRKIDTAQSPTSPKAPIALPGVILQSDLGTDSINAAAHQKQQYPANETATATANAVCAPTDPAMQTDRTTSTTIASARARVNAIDANADAKVDFIFKATPTGPVLRRRPWSRCKSVQMLYSQAVSAGVAASNTTLLSVSVPRGGDGAKCVVKDDEEDFNDVLEEIGTVLGVARGTASRTGEGVGEDEGEGQVVEVTVVPFLWSDH